jgi:hypothetical protein
LQIAYSIKHLCNALLLAEPCRSAANALLKAVEFLDGQNFIPADVMDQILVLIMPGENMKGPTFLTAFEKYYKQQQSSVFQMLFNSISDRRTPLPDWFDPAMSRRGIHQRIPCNAGGFLQIPTKDWDGELFGFSKS